MENEIYTRYTSTQADLIENSKSRRWYNKYCQKYIVNNIPDDKSIAILDIGCGYGRTLCALTNNGYTNLTGVDISPEQIEYAKKHYSIDNLHLCDAIDFLKGYNGTFDVILLIDIIEHMETEYLIELLKIIKEKMNFKGKIILQAPNAISIFNPLIHGDISHKKAFTYRSLEQVMKICNFKKVNHYPLFPAVHGLKSLVRLMLHFFLLHPFIKLFMLIQNGNSEGGIYTSSILTIVEKI
jgi:2-polyprenyl-3-methyl-5-hydroxy-6-metoxy-1,4-benzoquinol methylase